MIEATESSACDVCGFAIEEGDLIADIPFENICEECSWEVV